MNFSSKTEKYFLINTVLILIVGIIMVYSSSYIYSKETFGTSTHFFFKQLLFAVVGIGGAFVVSRTKMTFWYKYIYILNSLACTLLFLTMTPFGVSIKGSQRWISISNFSFQPGELIKYTVSLSAVFFFNKYTTYTRNEKMLFSLNFIIPLALLVAQPDFGTFGISLMLICFSCFLSDFPRRYFYTACAAALAGGIGILLSAPYRVRRILVFLDPWSDPQDSGFQIIQSYLAFANGHIFGLGIGNSNEKLFYLPEAYNDFILSVLGEELGFLGVMSVVILFLSFTFLGFKLALMPRSYVNKQIIAVLVFSIGVQASLNMGVVLGLLPTKGLNLPFVSYGGTSLISNLMAIGIILSCLSYKSQITDDSDSKTAFSQSALGFE